MPSVKERAAVFAGMSPASSPSVKTPADNSKPDANETVIPPNEDLAEKEQKPAPNTTTTPRSEPSPRVAAAHVGNGKLESTRPPVKTSAPQRAPVMSPRPAVATSKGTPSRMSDITKQRSTGSAAQISAPSTPQSVKKETIPSKIRDESRESFFDRLSQPTSRPSASASGSQMQDAAGQTTAAAAGRHRGTGSTNPKTGITTTPPTMESVKPKGAPERRRSSNLSRPTVSSTLHGKSKGDSNVKSETTSNPRSSQSHTKKVKETSIKPENVHSGGSPQAEFSQKLVAIHKTHKDEIDAMEAELNKLRLELESLRNDTKARELEEQLASLVKKLENQSEEHRNEIEKMNEERTKDANAFDEQWASGLEKETEQLRGRVDQLAASEQKSRVGSFTGTLLTLQTALNDLRAQLSKAKQDVDSEREQRARFQKQLDEKQSALESANKQLEDMRLKQSSSETAVADAKRNMESLKRAHEKTIETMSQSQEAEMQDYQIRVQREKQDK